MRQKEKLCKKCGIIKPINDFYKWSSKSRPFRRYSSCKKCTIKRTRTYLDNTQYMKKWNAGLRQEIENRTDRGILFMQQRLWHSAKYRAKALNRKFLIEKTDINIPTHCPILGIALMPNTGSLGQNSPVLDRINPELGYTLDNIQVISNKANIIKSNATIEDIRKLLTWMENQSVNSSPPDELKI